MCQANYLKWRWVSTAFPCKNACKQRKYMYASELWQVLMRISGEAAEKRGVLFQIQAMAFYYPK